MQLLGDLSKSPPFLPEVNDDAYTSSLCATNALLDCKHKVGLAGTNV
jgi:hypothetical protein